ncbi:replicative DNA helicase [Embleya sp. NPDC001921]
MTDHDEQALTAPQPHDSHAEHVVLGSIMRDPELADELRAVCPPEDYYHPAHADLQAVIADLHAQGKPTTDPHVLATATAAAGHHGRITEIGYLVDVWQAGFPAFAHHYAKIVAVHAAARRLVDTATRARQLAYGKDFDADTAVDLIQRDLDNVVRISAAGLPPILAPLVDDALDRIAHLPVEIAGIATGLPDLDDVYPGHAPGRITVVGARPGSGKTTMGIQFARHAAITLGLPTLFLTMEMGAGEITDRVLSAEAQVELGRITRGGLTDFDKVCLAETADRIAPAPLYIDDTPHVGLGYIRHKVKTLQRAGGLNLLIVDYLQLMQTERAENRQQQVAALSRGLKLLAKELAIPIVLLSQLNRSSAQRTGKRPELSDLRESGAVEQDADTVLLLHRDELYEPETTRVGELDVIVAKNRHGTTKDVIVGWQGEYARCVDVTRLPRGHIVDNGWMPS